MRRIGGTKRRSNAARRSSVWTAPLSLVLPCLLIILTSFLGGPSHAGWWDPRELVTDGIGNIDWSTDVAVATDGFGNVYVVWIQGGDLDGSGPDTDIFSRKWNATTQSWENRVLVTDDNLNNTENSFTPDVDTDPFGNVHIVWRDNSDLDGSGGDADIFWKMWNATSDMWGPTVLVSDGPNNTRSSQAPYLATDHLGNVHIVWTDDSLDPNPGIRYRKWDATTRTFGNRTMISGNLTSYRWSKIAVDPSGDVHVAWESRSNISGASMFGNDLDIFHRKLDVTTARLGPITHVNYDDDSDSRDSNVNDIASDFLGNVHIVWDDPGGHSMGGPDTDVYYRKWNATSGSWGSRVLVSNDPANTGSSARAEMCTDPLGNVHVVWGDKSDVDGAGPNYGDLFYKKWDSVTGLWENTKSLTNDLMDQYLAYPPDIASDNLGNVFLVWDDDSGLLGSGPDHDVYLRRYEADIILPDYMPVEVSPPTTQYVLPGSSNPISAKVYNGGEISALTSEIAFYESPTPGSPFFMGPVPPLGIGERSSPHQSLWTAPSTPGTYEITIEVDYGNAIPEVSEENNYYRIEFIVETPPPPPLPPTNLTTEVVNDDAIFLNWTASDSPSVDHYLIYRSSDQRDFDLSTPTYDTSDDTNPLRTNWTDIDAASPSAPREYYYTVRAVDGFGLMSITSNTAGKWTKIFSSGLNTFSLPLEPFMMHNVSWYVDNILNVAYIRWMDSTGHWVAHYEGTQEGINDIPVEMGRGYETFLTSDTRFTFCGYPASMIRFHEGLGDAIEFRKSLSTQRVGSNVILGWNLIVGATEYKIFRSNERNGLHNLSLQPIDTVPSAQSTWTDFDILSSEGEYYYMVIPVDSQGELGSSTYSIGVVTIEYQPGSDTYASPLKMEEVHSLDWFCDEIPNVVGMAYMIFEVWKFHAMQMPAGVYDVEVLQSEGYQISIDGTAVKFTFVGY